MSGEVVEFTVRCALQTFEDRKIECPNAWTVLELKKHLNEVCASKPDVTRMRLIYSGHCLENTKTLREIFNKRHEGMEGADMGPQVIHMVCAPTQMASAKESMESNLRRRQPAASTTSFSQPPLQNNAQQFFAPYAMADQTNVTSQQQAYYNYVAAYQNYMQAMSMGFYQHGGQHFYSPYMQLHGTAQAFQFPQNGMNVGGPQQLNFDPNVAVANQQVNIQAQPAAAPVQNVNIDEQPNDLLDVIYKFIRFGLFLMILFLYSSMERFFVVCIVICVVWFLHMRRDRGQLQQQQMAQEVNNNQRAADDAVNDNNNNQVPTGDAPPNTPETPTAWNVFWSTVSSFFTSLIPENPVPMNVN